jgi:hypothetical protein
MAFVWYLSETLVIDVSLVFYLRLDSCLRRISVSLRTKNFFAIKLEKDVYHEKYEWWG